MSTFQENMAFMKLMAERFEKLCVMCPPAYEERLAEYGKQMSVRLLTGDGQDAMDVAMQDMQEAHDSSNPGKAMLVGSYVWEMMRKEMTSTNRGDIT
jgi:hypothetical protein